MENGRTIGRSAHPYAETEFIVLPEVVEPRQKGLPRSERTQSHLERYKLREGTRDRIPASTLLSLTGRAQIGRIR